MKPIKYKIKSLRVESGLKQKDFANTLGISRQYLGRIENENAKNISKGLMIKIAKALNSTVQELFFSDEE